jgi:hypothetical protein
MDPLPDQFLERTFGKAKSCRQRHSFVKYSADKKNHQGTVTIFRKLVQAKDKFLWATMQIQDKMR